MAVTNAKCPECRTVVRSDWKFCPGCSTPVSQAFEGTAGEQAPGKSNRKKINWVLVLSIAGVVMIASLGYVSWLGNAPERFERQQQAELAKDREKLHTRIIEVFGSQMAFDQFLELEVQKKLVVARISRWRPEGQFYHIDGVVENGSNRQVVYWRVDFEVLNENGDVISFGLKNSITPIAPGKAESWSAVLRGADPTAANVSHRVSEVRFDD